MLVDYLLRAKNKDLICKIVYTLKVFHATTVKHNKRNVFLPYHSTVTNLDALHEKHSKIPKLFQIANT